MKIGYDGKRAVHNMTGLGNYSRLILESVGKTFSGSDIVVYTPTMRDSRRLNTLKQLRNVSFRLPDGNSLMTRGALWRTFGIKRDIKRDGIQLFHGLSNELPLNIGSTGIPSVVTIHDVIYRRLPYCYSWADRLMYDYKYGTSCHNATRIIAVSERTKQDIVELYGVNPEKIDVVYQGCDESFKERLSAVHLEQTRKRYDLPKRYLLQVGTIERRKNLEISIRALSALPPDIHLVAVGKGKDYLKKMHTLAMQLGVGERVHILSNITFCDLPAINQRAEVILYPSRYEGFGIPVLEGLESSRPVIAATGSCLEEAGGNGAWYVNPDDPRQLQNILSGITDGSIDTATHIAAGKTHARRFDNANMAEEILKVYRKCLPELT